MRPDGSSTFCALSARLQVLHREIEGRQPLAVDPDAHGIAALAEDRHVGDAVEVLQPVEDEAVDVVGDLQRGHAVAGEHQVHDRLRVRLDLGDGRLLHLDRQAAAHAADAVAHVAGGHVGIDIGVEADGDAAGLGAAGRFQHVDAGNAGDRALEHLRDLALDDGRRGAGIAGRHRDHRLVDVGILAHRQPAVGHDAEQHQHQAQHRGEDGPADAELEQAHVPPFLPAGAGRAGALDDLDGRTVAQLELAGRDDLGVRRSRLPGSRPRRPGARRA